MKGSLAKAMVITGVTAMVMGSGSLALSKEAASKEDSSKTSAPMVDKAMPMGDQQQGKAGMSEEMMAKWKEYATPNENHKILDQLVGDWEYSIKSWMSSEAAPEEATGTAQAKWIMDGRFVEQTVQGTHMGESFVGQEVTGFDNATKEYVSTWFDSMGTGMMIAKGIYDPASKILTESGDFMCPLRGQMKFRWETKIIDQDNYIFECYTNDQSGKEYKSMEIVYKRKT